MSFCRFGYPSSPGSPIVFFCDDEATESFSQPVPGPVGYAVNVRVCDAHAEHLVFLAREVERTGEIVTTPEPELTRSAGARTIPDDDAAVETLARWLFRMNGRTAGESLYGDGAASPERQEKRWNTWLTDTDRDRLREVARTVLADLGAAPTDGYRIDAADRTWLCDVCEAPVITMTGPPLTNHPCGHSGTHERLSAPTMNPAPAAADDDDRAMLVAATEVVAQVMAEPLAVAVEMVLLDHTAPSVPIDPNVQELAHRILVTRHEHTETECGHTLYSLEVEGATLCSHCGEHYITTEWCPHRCEVTRDDIIKSIMLAERDGDIPAHADETMTDREDNTPWIP